MAGGVLRLKASSPKVGMSGSSERAGEVRQRVGPNAKALLFSTLDAWAPYTSWDKLEGLLSTFQVWAQGAPEASVPEPLITQPDRGPAQEEEGRAGG